MASCRTAQWIVLRNARLPERLVVKDLVHQSSETFEFTDQRAIAGYAPTRGQASRFEFIAILSDGSFRFVDHHKNEIVFSAAGRFEEWVPSPGRKLLSSVSDGHYLVRFTYTIHPDGQFVVAESDLSDSGGQTVCSVADDYDEAGRACDARQRQPLRQTAAGSEPGEQKLVKAK